ncbi:hypothetical protein LOK49_LG07G03649 [Camellia lanceoleosa]|uniref:Uncharacterized protein n=1 Tax=Camellia lanceoleosa TaxID=1840588 RepID=A0ACC0H4B9_9ERIC|nr:hypothetical protein LOK49_LG07G03649 [Camellia lanceoleosa]
MIEHCSALSCCLSIVKIAHTLGLKYMARFTFRRYTHICAYVCICAYVIGKKLVYGHSKLGSCISLFKRDMDGGQFWVSM